MQLTRNASDQAAKAGWTFALAFVVLSVLVYAIYWPGLSGHFIFDDFPNVVDNPSIQLTEFSVESLRKAANTYQGPLGRPIATISIALDHLWFGMNPAAFKRTNLFIHIINSLLVFLLTSQVLRLSKLSNQQRHITLIAAAVALVWAIHPLQVSTVLYIVQRMEMLAVLFSLASLIFYCHGRQIQLAGDGMAWPRLSAAAAFALLATLSKENGILVFGYWLALELTLFQFRAYGRWDQNFVRGFFLLGTLGVLILFAFFALPNLLDPSSFGSRDFNAWERVLTQMRVVPMYLSWYVLPIPDRFVFFYDQFQWSTSLLSPLTTFVGLAFLIAVAVLGWTLRRKQPLISLGIFWFFIAHAITSNAISLELVFEHRNYFSLLAFLITAVGLGQLISKHLSPKLLITVSLLIIAGLGLVTHIQARTWGDRINLTMHLGAINPSSARAQLDRGILYGAMAGNDADTFFYQSGVLRLEKAAQLPSASIVPEQALIVLAALSGGEIQRHWWDSLHNKLETRPISSEMRSGVSSLLRNARHIPPDNYPDVVRATETVLGRTECDGQITILYGFFLLEVLVKPTRAEKAFEAALSSDRGIRLWPDAAARLEKGSFSQLTSIQSQPNACAAFLSP